MKRTLLIVSGLSAAALPAVAAGSWLDFATPLRVGRIDWVKIAPEGGRDVPRWLSGSVQRKGGKDVNVPVPCIKTKCRHLEFSDPVVQANPVLGGVWEVGKDHMVKGGFGPLAVGPMGREPTGRKVVDLGQDNEAEFKVVAESPSETSNSIVLRAYVRACIREPFSKKFASCGGYNIPTPVAYQIYQGQVMPVDIKTTPKKNPFTLPKSIKDLQAAAVASVAGVAPLPTGGVGASIGDGKTATKIVANILSMRGFSSAAGPAGGREACAWAVNQVLYKATGRTIGSNTNYVPSVEAALQSGQGVQVSRAGAAPGDIIIARDARHIGFCLTYGCTRVLSNSSSRAVFAWESDSNFGGSYNNYPGTEHFYRVK